jgi:hypothetical protein
MAHSMTLRDIANATSKISERTIRRVICLWKRTNKGRPGCRLTAVVACLAVVSCIRVSVLNTRFRLRICNNLVVPFSLGLLHRVSESSSRPLVYPPVRVAVGSWIFGPFLELLLESSVRFTCAESPRGGYYKLLLGYAFASWCPRGCRVPSCLLRLSYLRGSLVYREGLLRCD